MKNQIFLLETVTNLHVGDLGNSLSIVDKTVQRDALTQYPTIYATSLKGALRNAFEAEADFPEKAAAIKYIFGGKPEAKNADDAARGEYRFSDAHTLFYPVRANDRPYYLATCPAMIQDACRLLNLAGYKDKCQELKALQEWLPADEPGCILMQGEAAEQSEGVRVAHLILQKTAVGAALDTVLNKWVEGETALVLLSDQEMQQVVEELPIVARNCLDNGISANLWYEEFVPRKTAFLTLLMMKDECATFTKFLTGECRQIGANATVGYGLCSFREVKEARHE